MVNGAAIGLITTLVAQLREDVREDLHDLEDRLGKRIDCQAGDLSEIEAWRQSEMDRRTRQDGQWSVLRNAAHLAERYGKVILAAAVLGATALAAFVGVNIRIGG